jgi:hypothetical protein
VLEDKQADHVIVSLAMDKELRRMVLPNQKGVFIVYGRNEKAYNAMRLFLQSLKLEPLTFDEVRNELGGSPTKARNGRLATAGKGHSRSGYGA